MEIIKSFLARLYFFYIALVFLITLLPVAFTIKVIYIFIKDPKQSIYLHRLWQIWLPNYLRLIFCPVKINGLENFKKNENYVIVANHNSFIDVPVSSSGIPFITRTLAKQELSTIPIFGIVYRAGSILVDRNNRRSKAESFIKMVDVLKKGWHICLYPEGTRNNTSKPLNEFHDGAFQLAIKTQKDIMPALIFGTKNILHPTKKFYALPHKIEFHFLTSISSKELSMEDVKNFNATVKQQMENYYLQHTHLI